MTNKNIRSKYEGSGTEYNHPFLLKPAAQDYIWGGRRLNDDFSKDIDLDPLAETWECSVHPDGLSVVASGPFQGEFLRDVLEAHPELAGEHHADGEIPILVKLIDADKDLSVQVHPDDEYAKTYENGQLGKTEMWYVLDASKGAKLVYGFHHDIDEQTVRTSILNGKLEKYLRKVPVKKNDVFFIEPGTVHAIGSGVLIAEIQENSNLTYRLYDYDRVDKHGKKRSLHLDKALAVANLKADAEPNQPMRVLRYQPGYASELLCRCRHFQVERILINTERMRDLVEYRTDVLSFRVLLCIDGCGAMFCDNSETIRFFKGDCVFIPANSVSIKLHGNAQFLDIGC